VAEELIGPGIVKGRAWKVYATGICIITGNDCDIRDGGGVGEREEGKKNGEGE